MRASRDASERARISEDIVSALVAESDRVDAEGPLGPYDTTYSVPHQQDTDRVVVFDLLTVTIDDIVTQCRYPESARASLAETHRRIAAYRLAFYKGPIRDNIPLLEVDMQAGIA